MAELDTNESYEALFCGNCGVAVAHGSVTCDQCGSFLDTETYSHSLGRDYVPYCRACGVPVPKDEALDCTYCGVTPLCSEHFYTSTRSCSLCSPSELTDEKRDSSPLLNLSNGPWANPTVVIPCPGCGARIRHGIEFCPDCGIFQESSRDDSKYSGFMPRLWAFVVDNLILFVAGAILFELLEMPALGFFITIPYYVGFTYKTGQTPGKLALKIMVVDDEGNIPNLQRVIIREVVIKTLPSVLLLAGTYSTIFVVAGYLSGSLLLLGYLWIIRDTERQGLHDHVAGTFVIKKKPDQSKKI